MFFPCFFSSFSYLYILLHLPVCSMKYTNQYHPDSSGIIPVFSLLYSPFLLKNAVFFTIKNWLVVDLSLWKIWKSVGMIIHNLWKVIKFHGSSHHQAEKVNFPVSEDRPAASTSMKLSSCWRSSWVDDRAINVAPMSFLGAKKRHVYWSIVLDSASHLVHYFYSSLLKKSLSEEDGYLKILVGSVIFLLNFPCWDTLWLCQNSYWKRP